jgi:lipoate-protein ligase B
MKILNVIDLNIRSYKETYFLQKKILTTKKKFRGEDYIILVEHPNIFTIGRSGSRDNVLVDAELLNGNGLRIIDADRGGDVTFHGIGQLVAYPIFDLTRHIKDIRLFIKNLERVFALTVCEYGLAADREKKYTGLWVNGYKIGFIGIGISNWITYHGVSINANVDLKYFSMIRPCGIDNLQVSSLQKILARDVDINLLKDILIEKYCEVFGFEHPYRCDEDAFLAKKATSE